MNMGKSRRSPLTYLGFSLTTVVGFTSMYLLIGLLPSLGVSRLTERVSIATPIIGVFLVVLGILTAFSDVLSRVPVIGFRVNQSVGVKGLLFYGLGYGAASMSCGLPIFILQVLQSTGSGLIGVIVSFISYGLGAAAMIVPLTFAVAYSNQVIIDRFLGVLPYVKKASALMLVASGMFMIIINL
jgi:cytochrome c biogenesis protein CcdA